jgi:hypothetical protein
MMQLYKLLYFAGEANYPDSQCVYMCCKFRNPDMAIRLNYEVQAIRNNMRQAYYPPVVLKIYVEITLMNID